MWYFFSHNDIMSCKILLYKRGEQVKLTIKRIIIACLLGVIVLIGLSVAMSHNSVMDTVSFGHQVIRSGNAEINVELPYEIGRANADVTDEGYPVEAYQALTEHNLIDIEALHATADKALPTVEASADARERIFKLNGANDIQRSTVDLGNGVTAVKLEGTYRSRGVDLRFLQYVFMDHGVLWNILYQNPVKDEIGAGIIQQIQDHIQVIPKKEG